jgi:hypothetical protein
MMNEEGPGMQSQSNEFRPQATERLFLAVVNQAISDVLENVKEASGAVAAQQGFRCLGQTIRRSC